MPRGLRPTSNRERPSLAIRYDAITIRLVEPSENQRIYTLTLGHSSIDRRSEWGMVYRRKRLCHEAEQRFILYGPNLGGDVADGNAAHLIVEPNKIPPLLDLVRRRLNYDQLLIGFDRPGDFLSLAAQPLDRHHVDGIDGTQSEIQRQQTL